MNEKNIEPYEGIETRLNNMLNEVDNDFSSIIEYLEGVNNAFSKFDKRCQNIRSNLDNTNIPDCFSATVGFVRDLTINGANNLFFESTFEPGLMQLKNDHENYNSSMKDKLSIIFQLFQQNRLHIQNLVHLNESKNEQNTCIQFHKSLLNFMQDYDFFQSNTIHIINQCINLSRDAIRQIEEGVTLTMSLLMGKFSLATDLEDISLELNSVIDLQDCVKTTFNFNYIYQNFIVQKSLLDSKGISFFGLESVNRSSSKLKFSLKEATKGYKKDKPAELPDSQVSLNQGQEGEIVSFNGYSESWLANFTPQGQLYVSSDLIDVNFEK